MKHDEGAIEMGSVMILIFITALAGGLTLFVTSGFSYIQADTRDFREKQAAEKILAEIVSRMQPLANEPFDDTYSPILEELRRTYADYALMFTDISSGYHLDFLSDADLADSNLARFLFNDNTGDEFKRWRNEHGLSVSKDNWKEMVKDTAWNSCVAYGWLHAADVQSFAYRQISASMRVTETERLFPLVNHFPRMNINMIDPQSIRPLLARGSFRITQPEKKTDALINRLHSGPLLQSDISELLQIPVDHLLLTYLGSKTTFWKIAFRPPGRFRVEAVIAAIPKKDGSVQEIAEYQLVDRSFIDD